MQATFVGQSTLDHIGLMETLLEPGQREEMSTFSIQGAGSAANSAVVFTRWGGDASFIGKVGDDHRGRQIIRTLAEEGITTDGLVRVPEAVSQFSFRAVEHGSGRTEQMYSRGTVSALTGGEARPPDDIDVLVTDGSHPDYLDWLLDELDARRSGTRVVWNAGDVAPGLERFIERVDYLIAPEPVVSRFSGVGRLSEMADALLERGLDAAVMTLGEDGVYGATSDRRVRDEGLSVDVVDPEGAQDTFAGVFTFGLTEGWTFERCIQTGVRAGDLVKTELGTRRYIPLADDLERG